MADFGVGVDSEVCSNHFRGRHDLTSSEPTGINHQKGCRSSISTNMVICPEENGILESTLDG